ncbi:unnamed protein product [Caenorhabditis bovis]|uniref:C-type lectin domain-containing protein n=1 Tax=Caenorhabditis bovis TaxID=2654633 RepID=A0A8S1EMH4_9PELO|nr:unnamed protein product [Caenorhabditis bovis]
MERFIALFALLLVAVYGVFSPPSSVKYSDAKCENWDRRLNAEKCPAGWTSFMRNNEKHCVQVFPTALGIADAKTCCAQYGSGGVLAALANKHQVFANGGFVRIGFERKIECYFMNPANCRGIKGFRWLDPSISGTGAFKFRKGQPDYYHFQQHYGVMMTKAINQKNEKWEAGDMEDVEATYGGDPERPAKKIRGYACSIKALTCL